MYLIAAIMSNGCHDLMQNTISYEEYAITFVQRNKVRFHFGGMRKDITTNMVSKVVFNVVSMSQCLICLLDLNGITIQNL